MVDREPGTDGPGKPMHGSRHPRGFMRRREGQPGDRPGVDHLAEAGAPPESGHVSITCTDYGPELHEAFGVDDLDAFLEQARPSACAVRWIDVKGLHAHTIQRLQQAYSIHALAAEDVLHTTQRPKVETYEDHLFIVVQMLLQETDKPVVEQVSMIVLEDTLITFHEHVGDVWDRVRERIATGGSRLRNHGVGFLVYALLDAIVDHYFPVLEHYGDRFDELEARVLERPTNAELQALYQAKQELILLRRVIWPMRQALDELQRTERALIDEKTRTFLRDVQDHAFRVMDIVEAYRETSSSLTNLYMSSVANRMNEVMKVLTIMASLFIPITFLAGVYGMNFEHIPELAWPWAYPVFWALCIATTVGLLLFFRHKGWIGRPSRPN